MPKKKRQGPLYQRGEFRLDWDRAPSGELRSPYLAVFWYDRERRRGRSASTGSADLEAGKAWLDAFYLEKTGGQAICPTCRRPLEGQGGALLSEAIASYQILHAAKLPSADAIAARLDHVLDYLEASGQLGARCEAINEQWIGRFREWSARQPILSPKGKILRDRALSTIEASVAQLAAAIHFHTKRQPEFKSQPLRGLNQTPQHRASIDQIAAMMRYCIAPDISAELEGHWGRRKAAYSAEELLEIRRRERAALHRYLIISIASLCRPDAAYDFSLDPSRGQWISGARIANLNPKGRRQTKKFRATIPIAWQIAPLFDQMLEGWLKAKAEAEKARKRIPPAPFYVGPKSIRRAWNGMAAAIGLPGEREAGEKLIRRSMGDILRSRLPEEAWGEISMFMGHDRTDPITSLYAPFSPKYLRRVLSEIELIIDEIEAKAPGAFALGSNVISIRRKA